MASWWLDCASEYSQFYVKAHEALGGMPKRTPRQVREQLRIHQELEALREREAAGMKRRATWMT